MAEYAITAYSTWNGSYYSLGTTVLYSASGLTVDFPEGCRIPGQLSKIKISESGILCYTPSDRYSNNYGVIAGLDVNMSASSGSESFSITGKRTYSGILLKASRAGSGNRTFTMSPTSGYRAYGWLVGKGWSHTSGSYYTQFVKGGSLTTFLTASTVSQSTPYTGIAPVERKYYKVAFNGNGSTAGSMATQEYFYGVSYTLPANQFIKIVTVSFNAGVGGLCDNGSQISTFSWMCQFAGWATSSTGSKVYNDMDSVKNLTATAGGTSTLYAKWTTSLRIYSPNATRPGYILTGWRLSDGSGSLIQPGVAMLISSSKEYNAEWERDESTRITMYFEPGEGVSPVASKQVYPGEPVGTLPSPTRSGYTFLGWFLSTIGNDIVSDSTIAPDEDFIVYAHWQGDAITITFNPNGGYVAETTRDLNVGDQYRRLPIPVMNGKTFVGWFTSRDGGTQVSSTDRPSTSHTLWAHWRDRVEVPWIVVETW